MKRRNEEVTLVDGSYYLHLTENTDGVDYAAYDPDTGKKDYSGHISMAEIDECPIRSFRAAARRLAIEDIGLAGHTIHPVTLDTLGKLPGAGFRDYKESDSRRSIRFITSDYEELFRIPDGNMLQMTFQDHVTIGRCEMIDDYHFRLNTEIFHICQFAETMERLSAKIMPEPISEEDCGAWEIRGKGFLLLQACDSGWDYSILDRSCQLIDGGQLDMPELMLNEAREAILIQHGMEYRGREAVDYSDLLDRAAQAEEKSVVARLKAIPVSRKEKLTASEKGEVSL